MFLTVKPDPNSAVPHPPEKHAAAAASHGPALAICASAFASARLSHVGRRGTERLGRLVANLCAILALFVGRIQILLVNSVLFLHPLAEIQILDQSMLRNTQKYWVTNTATGEVYPRLRG